MKLPFKLKQRIVVYLFIEKYNEGMKELFIKDYPKKDYKWGIKKTKARK